MTLPRGTFKGLAQVLAPLSFWMAAGWAAYPGMILKIAGDMGEAMDAGQVKVFSYIMIITWVGMGAALAVYGFTGRDAADEDFKALVKQPLLCPYCGCSLPDGARKCQSCMNDLPV